MCLDMHLFVFQAEQEGAFDQKKWSHINPSLIMLLDDKERNHISLTVKSDHPSVCLSVVMPVGRLSASE